MQLEPLYRALPACRFSCKTVDAARGWAADPKAPAVSPLAAAICAFCLMGSGTTPILSNLSRPASGRLAAVSPLFRGLAQPLSL